MKRAHASLVAFATVVLAGCTSAEPTPAASSDGDPTPSAAASATAEATTTPPPSEAPTAAAELTFEVETFAVPAGSHPHDVAPAADGGVWYTAQGSGELGWLDPETGEVVEHALGAGSAPHGVITGPDGTAWITDGGLNAIVALDGDEVSSHPLDAGNANLNTATFDGDGVLWFTGQAGIYGSLDPETGAMALRSAPRGVGPYGITTTPEGEVFYSSLAGSYLGAIDRETGEVAVIDTPTPGGGGRRVWSDSDGALWVTEWFSGSLARYDPATETWTEWMLPGEDPMPYAVYVDELDAVWVTDFGANAILRFDPASEGWRSFDLGPEAKEVRQLLGREGEVWGAGSATDELIVVRYGD